MGATLPAGSGSSSDEAVRDGAGRASVRDHPGSVETVPYPENLHVLEHPPSGGWRSEGIRTVVLVHGTLDRASSFSRVVRRVLAAAPDVGVVTYDRRGYAGSRDAGPGGLERHIDDLLGIAAGVPVGPPVTVVGHSLGGLVALGAAVAEPVLFRSVGAFEPPLPWQGFRRPRSGLPSWSAADADPATEAERFFVRMVGAEAWERLTERVRAERRADGPALLADLRSFGGPAPFELSGLKVPAVFGRGGPTSQQHHRDGTSWAVEEVPGARLVEIDQAGHGAHLSHPDAFVTFVLATLEDGEGPVGGSA